MRRNAPPLLRIMAGEDVLIDARGEPIKSPVTGAEHRARFDLPHGFEYEIAEMGSASTKTGEESCSISRTATGSSPACT
jgi:hypothetical protein